MAVGFILLKTNAVIGAGIMDYLLLLLVLLMEHLVLRNTINGDAL
jgi:hypothetical protein